MSSLLKNLKDERARQREMRIRQLITERQAREDELCARILRLAEIREALLALGLQMARTALHLPGSSQAAAADLARQGRILTHERAALLKQHDIDPQALEVHWDCTDCKNTGWRQSPILPGQEEVMPPQKCHCLLQEELNDLYSLSGLSGPLQQHRFDQFDLTLYPAEQRAAAEMWLAEGRRFAAAVAAGQPTDNLLLMGDVGLGKTFLATAIVNEVIAHRQIAVYFTFPEFTELLRKFRFGDDGADGLALNQLMDVPLLVLDDLAAEKVSDWVVQELFNVLNHRINRRLPMAVSTNLTLPELGELYGDRIFSRLVGASVILRLVGEDIRLLQRRRKLQLE